MSTNDTIGYYMRDIRHLPRYTAPERAALIEEAYGRGAALHRRARHKLFHMLLWLPMRIAHRYARDQLVPVEDLIQVGNIAMLIALESWKPTKGAKLLTWLRWGIERDMQREKNSSHLVRYSDALVVSYDVTDADAFDYTRHNDMQEAMLDPNASAEPQDMLFQADSDVWVRVRALDPEERDVIMALYFNAQSLRDLAQDMGMSHMTVSRIRDRGLQNLQRSYNNE